MPNAFSSDHWYLRKHVDQSIFGPVSFSRIVEWARSAQVAPQDAISEDQENWTKAPMVPELQMDWLVQMGEELYYGPTTPEAVVEFYAANEIKPRTRLINCQTNLDVAFQDCDFFPRPIEEGEQPAKGSIRDNLQQRVRELEAALIEKRQQLGLSEETVKLLEQRVSELERQLRIS